MDFNQLIILDKILEIFEILNKINERLDNEEIKDSEEIPELPETPEGEEDTVDWRPEALKYKGIAQRYKTKFEKSKEVLLTLERTKK
jgi:hypothetical protein